MHKLAKKAPYPSIGECLRFIVGAIDGKSIDSAVGKKLDRLVKDGDFDWSVTAEIVEKLIVQPLREIDSEIIDFASGPAVRFKNGYIDLVLNTSLDGVDRANSFPVLIEHLFLPNLCWMLVAAKRQFGGPELIPILCAKYPLSELAAWLEDRLEGKGFVPKDDELRGYVKAIKLGRDLPSLMRVKLLKACLLRLVGSQSFVFVFIKWLLILRAVEFCARRAEGVGFDLYRMMRGELLAGLKPRDIGLILSDLNYRCSNSLADLRKSAFILHHELNPSSVKSSDEQIALRIKLDEFRCLASQVDKEGRTLYWLEWCEARWCLLSGEYSEALVAYEKALQMAVYRAGENQEKILREGIVLAAYCGDKVLVKRFKQQGIAFGFFAGPLSEWEMKTWADMFGQLFPRMGHFPNGQKEASEARYPFLMINLKDVKDEKPDLRYPDRVIKKIFPDGQERRYPQLVWFATFSVDVIRKLIDAGADVDKLDSQGGSALLNAIQCASDGGQREVLDFLLNVPHAKKTVNSKTKRKELTPLRCAVDLGDASVVSRLIEMGAEVDLRSTAGQTPLYVALEHIGLLVRPQKNKSVFRDAVVRNDMPTRELRRILAPGIDVFGQLREEPGVDVLDSVCEAAIGKWDYDELLRMLILLLEAGADPNCRHEYPVPGRTPLMLAAEDDVIEAFKLMIEMGGDPWLKDDEGLDCFSIAFRFQSEKVVSYLRSLSSQ